MADVQKKFAGHTDLGGMDFSRIKSTVSSVIEHLKDNPVSAALITKMGSEKNYLAEHSGNVFYLSMVLGSAMKDYVVKERQRQTAANNLSHSLAMDLLPLGLGEPPRGVAVAPAQELQPREVKCRHAGGAVIVGAHPVAHDPAHRQFHL